MTVIGTLGQDRREVKYSVNPYISAYTNSNFWVRGGLMDLMTKVLMAFVLWVAMASCGQVLHAAGIRHPEC